MAPRDLAGLLAKELESADGIGTRRDRRPGLPQHQGRRRQPRARWRPTSSRPGRRTARNDLFAGEKINLEFVSANPTGPLHIGGTRWAAVGDALGRVFTFSGAEVTREYYFNDHGAQIDRFSRSLLASARGQDAPEDGYGGAYISEIVDATSLKERPDTLDLPDDEAQEVFRAGRRQPDVRRDQGDAARVRRRLRRLLPRGQPAQERRRAEGHRPADRARQHLRAGRRALAAHREVRRRQGPGDRPVQRRAGATSRATSPTTSTSASAASTAASSCSAPTTTGTSRG